MNDTLNKPLHSDNSTNHSLPNTTQHACLMSQAETWLPNLVMTTNCSNSDPHQSNDKPLATCPPLQAATNHHCSKPQASPCLWHPLASEIIMFTNKPTTTASLSTSAEYFIHHSVMLASDEPKITNEHKDTSAYHKPSSHALTYCISTHYHTVSMPEGSICWHHHLCQYCQHQQDSQHASARAPALHHYPDPCCHTTTSHNHQIKSSFVLHSTQTTAHKMCTISQHLL